MNPRTPRKGCALITGASQGLGRAFAEECAGRGMALGLVALAQTGLPDVAKVLQRAYRVPIEIIECDLTCAESPEQILGRLHAAGLAVDTLINNAGIGFTGAFADASAAQNETTIQLNVAGLVRLTQRMLPELRERSRAWVLNVASMGAWFPMPSMPLYSSTKTFVLAFSRLLRAELRQTGIRVSTLCPNGIRTNRDTRDLIEGQGLAGRLVCRYPDEVARAGLRGLYRGRALIVPGVFNRMLAGISPLVPPAVSMHLISRRWAPRPGRLAAPSEGAPESPRVSGSPA